MATCDLGESIQDFDSKLLLSVMVSEVSGDVDEAVKDDRPFLIVSCHDVLVLAWRVKELEEGFRFVIVVSAAPEKAKDEDGIDVDHVFIAIWESFQELSELRVLVVMVFPDCPLEAIFQILYSNFIFSQIIYLLSEILNMHPVKWE